MLVDKLSINRRTVLILVTLTTFVFIISGLYTGPTRIKSYLQAAPIDEDDFTDITPRPDRNRTKSPSHLVGERPVIDWVDHDTFYMPGSNWRVVFSQSTRDKKYFHIDPAGLLAQNPSILPHPARKGRYIVTAQSLEYRHDLNRAETLVCIAQFKEGVLHCPLAPVALPVALSVFGDCQGDLAPFNMHHGPRDTRVFYGPDEAYAIYGSQSHFSGMCLGLWIQNFWTLLDGAKHPDEGFATSLMEIGRPSPYEPIQKNFFLFWDNDNRVVAHYDMWPKRSFSYLQLDGNAQPRLFESNGEDLALNSEEHDQACIQKLFRKSEQSPVEGIHQATNSLSITMCKREDPTCVETDDNTFIMTIMQYKKFTPPESIYEPYPVLFQRHAPHALHAVATKPIFYFGTNHLTNRSHSNVYQNRPDFDIGPDYITMIYTSSLSWKDPALTYHGYMDDVLFIGFGVEDTSSAAIDVFASDLLQDLGFC